MSSGFARRGDRYDSIEARALRVLGGLKDGEGDVDQVAARACVAKVQSYRALESLREKGLVTRISGSARGGKEIGDLRYRVSGGLPLSPGNTRARSGTRGGKEVDGWQIIRGTSRPQGAR